MTTVIALAPGMLIALGVCVLVLAFRPQHARLDDALAALSDATIRPDEPAGPVDEDERVGSWWLRTRRVVVTPDLEKRLRLKGISVARHYNDKVVYAIGGFVLPIIASILFVWFGLGDPLWPLLTSVIGAGVGFFLPDLRLRGQAPELNADATESLLTYFDLVTLERLANQSATQSLHAAARLSDNTLFATIRNTLDRARLEQRMPYADLKQVGRDLDLPALVDLADVMRLDESGAALSGALRARVRELRDAHLTAAKVAATTVSERMTVFMVIPSMVFALIFLTPPLLRLVLG